MVRKGHRGCPSTERCSFQSLSEGNIYARQPTDARDSTAPAVRSEIRNSLSLRLSPLFASTCARSYPGNLGSKKAASQHTNHPLFMPNLPKATEEPRAVTTPNESFTTILARSTSLQHHWAKRTQGQVRVLNFQPAYWHCI